MSKNLIVAAVRHPDRRSRRRRVLSPPDGSDAVNVDQEIAAAAQKIGMGDFAGASASLEKVVAAEPVQQDRLALPRASRS